MSVDNHIIELNRKHEELEAELHQIQQNTAVSDKEVMEVKRRKLHIKDELARLASQRKMAS